MTYSAAAQATQQKYIPPNETPLPMVQVAAKQTNWEFEATQQKYVPPMETSSPLVQVTAGPGQREVDATEQRHVLPKTTPTEPLLHGVREPHHFDSEVIDHMLKAPLLDGCAHLKEQAEEEGAVNLDVEGDDASDGAPPKQILYASYVLILTYWIIGFLYGRFSAGWSLVDSMYFVAVTVTTVGYGDRPFKVELTLPRFVAEFMCLWECSSSLRLPVLFLVHCKPRQRPESRG